MEGAHDFDVLSERIWEAIAEVLRCIAHLNLTDFHVLGSPRVRLDALPWERAHQEVHEDIAQCLEVITTTLLTTEMSVDGCISNGAHDAFIFPVGDVLTRGCVAISLCETKIDDINQTIFLAAPDEEVLGFYIPVDEVSAMNELKPRYQLVDDHQNGLQRECTGTHGEELLEIGAEKLHHHHIGHPASTKVLDRRDADTPSELIVDLIFML